MKMVKKIICFSLLLLLVASCATSNQQVKQQNVHELFSERIVRDSIFLRDSVSLVQRADTVFLERVRTLYRDRVRVDTFMLCDTIYSERVERVEVERSRNLSCYLTAFVLLLLLLLSGLPQKIWCFLKKL